jgi:hypothetical protein
MRSAVLIICRVSPPNTAEVLDNPEGLISMKGMIEAGRSA